VFSFKKYPGQLPAAGLPFAVLPVGCAQITTSSWFMLLHWGQAEELAATKARAKTHVNP
jgi:hypothetical protein